MISNAEYFKTLTVPQLKARLIDFNAVGISRLRKAELINMLTVLMDGAHLDAIEENRHRVTSKIAAGYLAKQAESYAKPLARKGMTAAKRMAVYYSHNRSERLTARQARRLNKKIMGRKIPLAS